MSGHSQRRLVQAIVATAALAASACGDGRPAATTTPSAPSPTLQSVQVQPTQVTVDLGATQQLKVVAFLSDRTERDVTAEASWGVSDPRILTIAPGGLARAVGYGTGFYSATYQGMSSIGAGRFVVEIPASLKVAFTGIVRDQHGRPVPGAAVLASTGSNVEHASTSDGNGFFDLGAAYGTVRVNAAKFGYDNGAVTVLDAVAQPRAEIVLVENPSPFIERVIEDEVVGTSDVPVTRTHAIVGRAGTTLDVIVVARSASDDGYASGLELFCGAQQVFPSSSFAQIPGRYKTEMPDGGCRLVVSSRTRLTYRATYREAR
jgi:hypothetical protein